MSGAKALMRLFLAVFPPPEVQAAAFGMTEALRRQGDPVSWVKRENLHYTLLFLGELGEDGARRAGEAAAAAAGAHAAFAAALGAPGAFPNPRKPRVLWLSMTEGAEALGALSRSLEAELARHGFDRADHPFSPHLTIGRVRESREDWTARLAAVGLPAPAALRFRVEALNLMQSDLSPRGAHYTVRVAAPLHA